MKRNSIAENSLPLQPLVEALIWYEPATPDLSIAAYVDDGSLTEAEFMSCLPVAEQTQATRFTNITERRHFIARRSFQRLFLCVVSGWNKKPSDLSIVNALDTAPHCIDFPELHFSFSSSGATAIACASGSRALGIDVERTRPIANVLELALRYFEPDEAAAVSALPPQDQNQHFLLHWTAKEAGLKAAGRGIISGLNLFTLQRDDQNMAYRITGPAEIGANWRLQHIELLPFHVIALVEKISVDKPTRA